jgi:VIT1/CCC1 family predicted Fe2+/Mn2+ transporter
MADKNVQNYLVAVLGIFVFFILTMVGSFLFGETIWMKIALPVGIGLVTIIVVNWLRRLTK